MTQSAYVKTLNLLLQAQHAFSHDNPALGTSCLVAAEQTIPEIEDCQQFLNAQLRADDLWRDHMIGSGLVESGVRELRIHNQWQVA